ncbi:MAG: hypothetical protein J7527_13010, partial [Chitinophagaceae bacterium]|nr:hypothetical protein [Chitinophagaceae bacterium]
MHRLLHTTLILCTCLLLGSGLYAQPGKETHQSRLLKELRAIAERPPYLTSDTRSTPSAPGTMVSPALQLQLQKELARRKSKPALTARPGGQCEDTSFVKLIGLKNAVVYVQTLTTTADDGVLVGLLMWDSTKNLPQPSWIQYGVLARLDPRGEIEWVKQFDDLSNTPQNLMYINGVFELTNGDIVCSASWNTDGSSSVYNTLIYRLDRNGNERWRNTFKSNVGIFNSPSGTFTFDLEGVTEGLNGDLIIAGTTRSNLSSGKMETIARLNNAGKLVWDANYLNYGTDGSYRFGAEGISAMVQNGEVILIGISHGTNNPVTSGAINISRLRYSDGTTINNRFFRPIYPDKNLEFYKGFSFWKNQWQRLNNGHYVFSGVLYADLSGLSTVGDHFGVVEFDAQFNLVDAYSIGSTLKSNYYNSKIDFSSSGKGLFTILEYIGSYVGNVYFGSIENKQILKERKAYIEGGMPGNNGFAIFKDKSYAYVQTNFQLDAATNATSYFEFRKMHDSDT